MRVRMRAAIVVTIILALSMISVPGLGVSQMVFGGVLPAPTPLYPVVVSLSTGENVFIASHTSKLADGNWIQLSGGTSIKIPSLTLAYAGLDSATYTPDGVTVTIQSSFEQGEATYPLPTHHVYSTVQSITAKFCGASSTMGPVDFKLLKLTSLTEARTILTEAFQGNLAPLKTKLSGATWSDLSVGLDGVGDASVTIDPQSIGNYLLVVVKEDGSDIYINSATIIEVVKQTLYVTCPSSVEKDNPLNVNTGLTGLTYIQGAIMIKETAYSGEIKLVTDGTVLSTAITLNELLMADGAFAIATESISVEDVIILLEKIEIAIHANQMSIDVNLISGSLSLDTYNLIPGDYILLVGVYDILGSKIVGVYQKTVTVTPTYVPPPSPPSKNKLPVADAGPDQKAWVNRTVNFDGSKSTDPDGYIVDWGWTWNFGDGETASGETVSHTYQEPGSYTVTLTVKDNRYGEDSDTCTATISEPPQPVTDELAELVPGGEIGYIVNATVEANTTVTLNTTDPVTVTILKYEDNPHPEDPIPAMALPNYVDVMVSDPDAVSWPIYVEMSYTDEEIEGLDESTLGIYYWKNGTWQRCSNTGVDTERNVVWAYMTREEAAGSPIVVAGMHAITPPPLPPFLDSLVITPEEIELGDNVTISFIIRNSGSQHITYGVDIHIEDVSDPPPTWPPPHEQWLRIWVELDAYEIKTVSHTITPDTSGVFNVTVAGMTASFKVGTWPPEPPPLPPILTDLTITPAEIEIGEEVTISFDIENIDSQPITYIVVYIGDLTLQIDVELGSYESKTVFHTVTPDKVGEYEFTIDGLTGSFTVKALPTPAEFETSNLVVTPQEIVPGGTVMVSATITNIGEESGSHTVELKLDGQVVASESITLNGGASVYVTLTTSSETEGRHSVEIDGLSGSFTVEAPAPPKKTPWIWIVLLVVLVAILLYIWRRTDWIDQLRTR